MSEKIVYRFGILIAIFHCSSKLQAISAFDNVCCDTDYLQPWHLHIPRSIHNRAPISQSPFLRHRTRVAKVPQRAPIRRLQGRKFETPAPARRPTLRNGRASTFLSSSDIKVAHGASEYSLNLLKRQYTHSHLYSRKKP